MAGMSDRASSDLPPPERAGETLWVVDVTAPLAPGRVRWVAGEAAARLQLPAEKLVALLENRIGPVTKPLPKASADRVAEVLDLAGAEVSIRAAGPSDRGRGSAEARKETDPQASEAAAEAASERASAPESGPESGSEYVPEAASESVTAARSVSETVPDPAPPPGDDPEPESSRTPPVDVATDATRFRTQAGEREQDVRSPADEHAASEAEDTAATSAAPVEPEGRAADAEASPPVGRPGATRRDRDVRDDDPWESLEDDEDEAMLGAWTHRAASAPFEPVSPPASRPSLTGAADGGAASGRDQAGVPRAAPRAAPPAAAPGGRPPGTAAPTFDPSDPPHVVIGRDADDEDDDGDEGWTYGLRDPFAEAERRERAVRRWALVASLLVALGIFLVLQWAYSRPGPGERTPPPYEAGLAAYREGAFVSAARAWAPRAEAGDADAMFMLGWMAEYGQGRPWSNREAAGWYAQAAQRGHAPSQLRLADLYAQGLGVAFDRDVATRWYLAAAEAGLPRAQREAALAMAHAGRHAEAAAWLDAAAAHDPDAAAWLALMRAARTLNPRSE